MNLRFFIIFGGLIPGGNIGTLSRTGSFGFSGISMSENNTTSEVSCIK